MHLILHDLPPETAQKVLPPQSESVKWFSATPAVKTCTGCFACWVKTPGECVIPDRGKDFCHVMAKATALTIVSRNFYGGLSPDVKAVLDRFIGYVLPWFTVRENEMHHRPRYSRQLGLTYHLYGDITERERKTALRFAAANALNMNAAYHDVHFHAEADELEVRMKKVALINGSPRGERGVSAFLLNSLTEKLPGCEITRGWGEPCDAYVFAFPLYVDGIPSNLLRELAEHEQGLPQGTPVYAIVNNGFYEGAQNAVAIETLRNWCERAGLAWGQGIGVGAGGLVENLSVPLGKGPLKNVGRAMDALAKNITEGGASEDIFTTPNLPRWVYKIAGEVSFIQRARKNKLKRKDLNRQLDTD